HVVHRRGGILAGEARRGAHVHDLVGQRPAQVLGDGPEEGAGARGQPRSLGSAAVRIRREGGGEAPRGSVHLTGVLQSEPARERRAEVVRSGDGHDVTTIGEGLGRRGGGQQGRGGQ